MHFKTLFIALFLLIINALSAQELHVHYNVYRDSVYYIQNGKSVDKPVVRRGNEVFLHVENYNNYLYEVSVKIENEELPVTSSNPTGLIGKTGGGSGAFPLGFLFKGVEQAMGAFKFFPKLEGADLEEGHGFGKTEAERNQAEEVIKLKKLEADFTKSKDQLFLLDTELKTLQEQIQQKLTAQRVQIFAVEEVNQIRLNSRLEPTQIKKLSEEYMQKIFGENDPEKIDLDLVLKVADAQTELPKSILLYKEKAERYAINTEDCAQKVQQMVPFRHFTESNLSEFQTMADQFLIAAKEKSSSLQEKAKVMEEKIPAIQSLDPKTISELRTTYLELKNNKFTKTYRHTATGEKLSFKLKLSPTDSLEVKGIHTLELTPVEVNVFGGMRVRASLGLNFGGFFTRPQEYFIRDSVLNASNVDAFLPLVTSFVHFYAPGRKNISIAGSFGVGFPLGAGDDLQSISFLLGPSLLFGKNERIVLNAGIMGGKVKRLSQGYKVGDLYFSDSNMAPTASVYQLGYYLGISFNL